MSERLVFADPLAAADALTFAGRTAKLGDGAVRMQGVAGTLAMTSAPLAPKGFGDPTPTVLAMRALPVDPELECDLVIEASELSAANDDARAVVLPDVGLAAPWAGITPPRAGWQAVAEGIDASVLAARAQWGIATVAEAMPESPGEDIVRSIRASVWGAPDVALGDLPLGVAFAAFAMGFIGGEETARVRTSGVWTRVTLNRGHLLVRRPPRMGLTDVRSTGTARP